MKVMVGSTFGIEVAAASAVFARDQPTETKISSSCLFLKEDDVDGGSDRGSRDVSSDSSSSIGSPGDSDDEEEEGVVSSGGSGGLSSLGSIEESLPIKRGLSNYYAGKSKSFGNLSDVCSVKEVKELQKAENPFNKKRRLLLANRWSRKSSFYSWQNPNSMPLFALIEDDEDAENKETPSSSSSPSESSSTSSSNDKRVSAVAANKPKLHQCNLKASFKSQSCFSLTDLDVERQ